MKDDKHGERTVNIEDISLFHGCKREERVPYEESLENERSSITKRKQILINPLAFQTHNI